MPDVVKQEQKKRKKVKAKMRVMVNVAVLKGYFHSNNLILGFCYDQNPFNMLTKCIEEVSWVLMTKKVFSSRFGEHVIFEFL